MEEDKPQEQEDRPPQDLSTPPDQGDKPQEQPDDQSQKQEDKPPEQESKPPEQEPSILSQKINYNWLVILLMFGELLIIGLQTRIISKQNNFLAESNKIQSHMDTTQQIVSNYTGKQTAFIEKQTAFIEKQTAFIEKQTQHQAQQTTILDRTSQVQNVMMEREDEDRKISRFQALISNIENELNSTRQRFERETGQTIDDFTNAMYAEFRRLRSRDRGGDNTVNYSGFIDSLNREVRPLGLRFNRGPYKYPAGIYNENFYIESNILLSDELNRSIVVSSKQLRPGYDASLGLNISYFRGELLRTLVNNKIDLRELELADFKHSYINGHIIDGLNLDNLDLSNSYISKSDVYYINFDNINFSNTVFADVTLHACVFRNINLESSRFINSDLETTVFEGINGTSIRFENLMLPSFTLDTFLDLQCGPNLINARTVDANWIDKFYGEKLEPCTNQRNPIIRASGKSGESRLRGGYQPIYIVSTNN